MRRFLVLLALAAPGACAQQAALPSAVPQTVNQSVSVIADEPLPLDAPDSIDRTVRRLSAGDDQTQPLYSSPEDLLRLDPSVTLEERGSGGIQADISIRGTTFEQTLVLVDGMRLNDPETGHLNMDLSLPLEAVSRIDILHGAGSTLFGSDAIGGAINLITTAPTRNSAMLELGGGNMGQTEQHFQLSSTGERLATRLTGARDTSDGFFYEGQNDCGYHSNVLSLDTFISPRKGLQPTEMILGASDRPYGANLFYGDYDSAERTKGWLAAIRQPLPANLQADFAYRKHTDEYILLVQDPALYENNHIDTLWQADLRGSSTAGRHFDLAYGLESDGDAIRSNSLGHHARNQGAGYANLALHALGRLTLSIGGREEVYAGPNSIFTPTVSAGYFLGHGLHAHAAAGRGFRLPTYVDLYYADPATIGNSQLKPENFRQLRRRNELDPAPRQCRHAAAARSGRHRLHPATDERHRLQQVRPDRTLASHQRRQNRLLRRGSDGDAAPDRKPADRPRRDVCARAARTRRPSLRVRLQLREPQRQLRLARCLCTRSTRGPHPGLDCAAGLRAPRTRSGTSR